MARPSRRGMKEELQNRQNTESNQYRRTSSLFKNNLQDVKFFKCKEGNNLFDIIPYRTGKNDPISKEDGLAYILRVFIHSKAGQTGEDIICLEQTFPTRKLKCPVCAEYRRRIARGESKEDLPKNLRYNAWPRGLYNVWDRKDPGSGVQVFNSSTYLLQQYLDVISKKTSVNSKNSTLESYIPFADPDDGRSIAFDRQGTDEKSKFIGVHFEERDEVIPDEILDKAHCLDDLIDWPTEESAYEAFWGMPMEGGESEPKEESRSESRSERSQKYKEEPKDIPEPNDPPSEDDEEAALEKELERRKEEKRKKKEEEAKKEKKNDSSNRCPSGGKFGVSIDELPECDSCDLWKDCAKEQVKLEKGK